MIRDGPVNPDAFLKHWKKLNPDEATLLICFRACLWRSEIQTTRLCLFLEQMQRRYKKAVRKDPGFHSSSVTFSNLIPEVYTKLCHLIIHRLLLSLKIKLTQSQNARDYFSRVTSLVLLLRALGRYEMTNVLRLLSSVCPQVDTQQNAC